jgi:hypothetical protein
LHKGVSGQEAIKAFVLQYLRVAELKPDLGEDFVALPPPELEAQTGFAGPFLIEAKTSTTFAVRKEKVEEWLWHIDKVPVLLVHLDGGYPALKVRFLVLHDWLLENPAWPTRIARAKRRISFNLNDFLAAQEFPGAIEREAGRAAGKPDATWRFRLAPEVALSEAEVFTEMGHLGDFEVPVGVMDIVRRLKSPVLEQDNWSALRQLIRPAAKGRAQWAFEPRVEEWVQRIGIGPPNFIRDHERREFSKFVAAVNTVRGEETAVPFPGHTFAEISPWRVFVQLFPSGLSVLRAVLTRTTLYSPDQIAAALILCSTVANSRDSEFSAAAVDVLDEFGDRYSLNRPETYDAYKIASNYHFASAEAKGGSDVLSCIDFLARYYRRDDQWERRVHAEYYHDESEEGTLRAMRRKLFHPRARDIMTKPVTLLTVENLPRALRESL